MNINKYPYTDFHELNLDWFLAQFKTLTDAWDSQQANYEQFKEDVTTEFNTLSGKFDTLEETVQSFTRFIINYFDNLDVQEEINTKLNEMVSDGTMAELLEPVVTAQVPGAVTTWLNANVNPVGSAVVVDNSLSIAGAAADAKATGDVKNVTTKEIRNTTTTNIFSDLTWSDGYMGLNGTVAGGNTYRHSQIYPVSPGDIVFFVNPNFTFNFITAFANNVVVESAGLNGINRYTVPQGIDGIVISEYTSRGDAAINLSRTDVTLVNALSDVIDEALDDTPVWSMDPEEITWTTGKYIDKAGVVHTSTGLNYSTHIPVHPGDVLFYANDNYQFRFVCAYDDQGIALSDVGSNTALSFYEVPDGVSSVVVTVYDSTINSGTDLLHVTNSIEKRADTIAFGQGSTIVKADSMIEGDRIRLPGNNCKIGSRYQFSCKIVSFDEIEFIMDTTHVIINNSNIIFKNGSTTQLTVPHGLTISQELLVILENETSVRPSRVVIRSLGNEYIFNGSDAVTFLLDKGIPTLRCNAGELTDCNFSFTSSHIFAPVWIFGDSYLSWFDTRWTYYAAQDGNTENVYFSGYAGQDSQSAIAMLNEALKLSKPKILAWCLGMNDPDSATAVNDQWNMCYEQIKNICDYNNIELVLYTTPTTPTMNNNFKNEIVRQSGYRYVDIDGLVRINDNGDWIAGALASDNVHPTVLGAKIIYHRFLTDLPEIMTK